MGIDCNSLYSQPMLGVHRIHDAIARGGRGWRLWCERESKKFCKVVFQPPDAKLVFGVWAPPSPPPIRSSISLERIPTGFNSCSNSFTMLVVRHSKLLNVTVFVCLFSIWKENIPPSPVDVHAFNFINLCPFERLTRKIRTPLWISEIIFKYLYFIVFSVCVTVWC